MLSHHYRQAQDWEPALLYLERSGDKAAAAYANEEALRFYKHGLEASRRLGAAGLEANGRIAHKRGFLAVGMGQLEVAQSDFEVMRQTALQRADRHSEALALTLRGLAEYWNHEFGRAEATLRMGLTIGEEGYDDVLMAGSLYLGGMCQHLGRMPEARVLLERARQIADPTEDTFYGAFWSIYQGFIQDWEARFTEAVTQLEQWDEAASTSLFTLAYNRWCRCLALAGMGEYALSVEQLHGLLSICQRAGEAVFVSRILNTLGWICGDLQNHERAIEFDLRGVVTAQELGAPDPEIECNARLNLGDSLMALGRLDEAAEQLDHVEAIVRSPSEADLWMLWRYAQHLCHSQGDLALIRGDAVRALKYADECIERAEATDSAKNVVKRAAAPRPGAYATGAPGGGGSRDRSGPE